MRAACRAVALLLVFAPLAHAAPPGPLTILRDAFGVPQLFTTGPQALQRGAYANGWAQAEDRLFELDVLRRAATGHLAELLGPTYLLMDEVVRRDQYTQAELAAFVAGLSPRNRDALRAFRDGVNGWIARVTNDPRLLPFEFTGTPPRLWEETDTAAIAVLEFVVFGANGGLEVLNADLLLDLLDHHPAAEARGIFDDTHWITDPAAPTTIAPEDGVAEDPDQVERFAPAQLDLVTANAASIRRAAASLRAETGLMGGLGGRHHASNAIVISPAMSATGEPLLLGGPQTGLNQPSFFWEVGLHGGGYDAEGVTGPAGPGVLIGRGRNFAYSITSGILDNVDTFIESLDPSDPEHYLFRGQSLPFEHRTETIAVSGNPDVTIDVRRTIHGPVFFYDPAAGLAYSRQSTFRGRELQAGAALTGMGFVRRLADFKRIADHVAVSLNLNYADTAGNIAYFHRGIRPLRPLDTDPRLPLDGRGTMEWRGRILPKHMPAVVNPKRGFITNWNNSPIMGWSAGEQRELWGVVDRVHVFIDALEAARTSGTKLTIDDVKNLMRQAATSDIFAARILPFLEDALAQHGDPPGSPLSNAVVLVRSWVGAGAPLVGVPDSSGVIPDPGAAIYTEFRTAAQQAVFASALGSAFIGMNYPAVNDGDQEDDHGSFGSPDALFLRVLFSAGAVPGEPAPPGLLPVSRDYFAPLDRTDVLVGALESAITTLTARFGTADETQWQMPALLETYRDLGVIGAVFGQTVQERENRGSFNLVVRLGSPVEGEIIVPPGESGTFTGADVGHEPPHLRDQLRLYEAFEYRRQPFAVGELLPPVTVETLTGGP